jgi:polyhydroxyalkanoate synthase
MDIKSSITEVLEKANKLVRNYDTISNIKDIDIGTTPKELVWEDGKVKLYHYNRESKPTCKTPILITYALVNRIEMLDLQPGRSFIANLLEKGLDIYIIDWGYPSRMDRYKTMSDYIYRNMGDCVDFVAKENKVDKINLAGVCQGGTFSGIYAATYPQKIKNLITMGAPFDFSTNDGLLFWWSRYMNIDAIVDNYGSVPGSFLNVGFEMLKPFQKIDKYLNFIDISDDEHKMANYLRMEKWIYDSPAQTGECYRQFLKDLYQNNKLIKGELVVGGETIDLKKITMPVLTVFATYDHIVPPSASKPFNDYIGSKDKQYFEVNGGHIGMFVGSKAQKELAPAIAAWLHERDK